jgi:hypothetical protein
MSNSDDLEKMVEAMADAGLREVFERLGSHYIMTSDGSTPPDQWVISGVSALPVFRAALQALCSEIGTTPEGLVDRFARDDLLKLAVTSADQRIAFQDEIERLKTALRQCARNDATEYDHHDPRRWDGKKPSESVPPGSIWLTPREIARAVLKEPDLATFSDKGVKVIIDQFELECVHCRGEGGWQHEDPFAGSDWIDCEACGGKGTRTHTITEDLGDG